MSLYTSVSEENSAYFLRVEGIELELTVHCVKTKKATIWFILLLPLVTVIVLLNFCSTCFCMHECLMAKFCPPSPPPLFQGKSV